MLAQERLIRRQLVMVESESATKTLFDCLIC